MRRNHNGVRCYKLLLYTVVSKAHLKSFQSKLTVEINKNIFNIAGRLCIVNKDNFK